MPSVFAAAVCAGVSGKGTAAATGAFKLPTMLNLLPSGDWTVLTFFFLVSVGIGGRGGFAGLGLVERLLMEPLRELSMSLMK